MALKETKQTAEHIAKRIAARRMNDTYSHSEETRLKIAHAKTGIKPSVETLKKRSSSLKMHYALHPERAQKTSIRMIRLHAIGHQFSHGKHWRKTEAQLANKRGARNPAWKGGITPINVVIRNSEEYARWRKQVFERDGYRCVLCGDDEGGNLQADHIRSFAFFPELRLDMSNGRTVCEDCHKNTPNFAGRAKNDLLLVVK